MESKKLNYKNAYHYTDNWNGGQHFFVDIDAARVAARAESAISWIVLHYPEGVVINGGSYEYIKDTTGPIYH